MDTPHTINGMIVEQIWKKHYRKRGRIIQKMFT